MSYRHLLLGVALLAVPAAATAAPTPLPGGANQVQALSSTVGQTIFNGALRVKIVEIREATAADNPGRLNPSPDQKVLVMKVLLRNGLHTPFIDLITYTLADKDDVSYAIPTSEVTPSNLHIEQAAAAAQVAMFPVDKAYVPTKVLVQCVTCATSSPFKTIRFNIP